MDTLSKAVSKALNLKQIAYQQASFADNLKGLARSVYESYPNLDDEVADEVKADLFAGYQLRVAENHPKIDQHFIVESGNFLPVEKLAFDNHKGEKYHRTVANVMPIHRRPSARYVNLIRNYTRLLNQSVIQLVSIAVTA